MVSRPCECVYTSRCFLVCARCECFMHDNTEINRARNLRTTVGTISVCLPVHLQSGACSSYSVGGSTTLVRVRPSRPIQPRQSNAHASQCGVSLNVCDAHRMRSPKKCAACEMVRRECGVARLPRSHGRAYRGGLCDSGRTCVRHPSGGMRLSTDGFIVIISCVYGVWMRVGRKLPAVPLGIIHQNHQHGLLGACVRACVTHTGISSAAHFGFGWGRLRVRGIYLNILIYQFHSSDTESVGHKFV